MAGAPMPLVSIGDFVKTSERICYVENIENQLGFSQYICVDIDSGVVTRKSRYQLEPVQVEYVAGDDSRMDLDDIAIQELKPENVGKAEETEEKRFATISEEDLDPLALNRNSKRTKSQTSWAISIFKEFLTENGHPENFESFETEKLATVLRHFYGSLKNKKGTTYSKSAYINICASINRHLTSPPYNKTINIMRDRQFMSANQVLTGVLRQLRESGKDVTNHKKPIGAGDMLKLYTSGVLSNANPIALQRKVYVELSLNFGRRGREGLRQLKKTSIIIKKDDTGCEYATLMYNEIEKNHQVPQPKEHEKRQIMYAQTEENNCPIKSLKKYLAKLNPQCDALFQRPKNNIENDEQEVWYENRCLGVHKLENIMKNISKEANLSEVYTNHCLRATASTVLSHAGVDMRNICSVTGHRNESSLQSYVHEPSLQQRAQMCDILHQYGKEKNDEQSCPDATHTTVALANTSNPTDEQVTLTSTTENISINTAQAVFAGATFIGPTIINVMINCT